MERAIINKFENYVITYMNTFENINSFIQNGISNVYQSSSEFFTIRFDYRLNGIDFYIRLLYDNKFEKHCETPSISGNKIDEFILIGEFLKHFKEIPENDLLTIIKLSK